MAVILESSDKLGDPNQGHLILNKIIKLSKNLTNSRDNYFVNAAIAISAARCGKWKLAHEAAENQISDSYKTLTLATVLKIWGEKNHPQLANQQEYPIGVKYFYDE